MDIGASLKAARKEQGKSVRDLAQSTKLSKMTIEAIESNEWSKLPGGIFGRACVRACAQEVGLDAETVVKAFVQQFPSAAPETIDEIDARPAPHNLRGLRWVTVAVVITALMISVAGAFYWFEYRRAGARTSADRGSR